MTDKQPTPEQGVAYTRLARLVKRYGAQRMGPALGSVKGQIRAGDTVGAHKGMDTMVRKMQTRTTVWRRGQDG